MGPKYELVISVVRVRQLPERLFCGREQHLPRRLPNSKPLKTLYAKGTVVRPGHEEGEPEQPVVKVSGPGVWDYGKQGDAKWGNAGVLRWRMAEKSWTHIRLNNPKVSIQLYLVDPDNPSIEDENVVGWFTMDMRKLSLNGSNSNIQKLKLQGCAPAIVEVSSSIKTLPRRSSIEDKEMKGLEKHSVDDDVKDLASVTDMDALPIGPGSLSPEARTFCFTVNIRGASNLEDVVQNMNCCVDPPPMFWFSYSLFRVVVQTDQFTLANNNGGDKGDDDGGSPTATTTSMLFVPVFDTFLLRSTPSDLANFFESMPPIRIVLCTEDQVVAHTDVPISELFPYAAMKQVPLKEKIGGFEIDCPLVSPLSTTTKGDEIVLDGQKGGASSATMSISVSITAKEIEPPAVNNEKADVNDVLPIVFDDVEKKGEDMTAATTAATTTKPKNISQQLPASMQMNSIQVWVSHATFYETANFTETAPAQYVGGGSGGIVFSVVPAEGQGVAKVVERPTVVQTRVSSGESLLSTGISAFVEFHHPYMVSTTPPPESAILYIVATCIREKEENEIGRAAFHWPESAILATETELHFKSSNGIDVGMCTVGMRKFGTERERIEKIEHLPFVPAPGLHHLQLTVKLVSIQCLSSHSAHMYAEYHYPHKMGSIPVRTAVFQVNQHGGEIRLNAVDSRSFVMRLEDFALCMAEEPIVVTLKVKEKNGERDLGCAKLPLEELVSVNPHLFEIPKKTNHQWYNDDLPKPPLSRSSKSLKRTQEVLATRKQVHDDISEPVQVRVLDQYLDLVSVSCDNEMSKLTNNNGMDNTTNNCQVSSGSNNNCVVVGSLQAVLILEDFGLVADEEEIDGTVKVESLDSTAIVMEQKRKDDTASATIVKPSSRKGRTVYYTPEGRRIKVVEEDFYPHHKETQGHFKAKGNSNAVFETTAVTGGWKKGNGSALPVPKKKKKKKIDGGIPFLPKDDKGAVLKNSPRRNPPADDDSALSIDNSSHNDKRSEVAELVRLRDEWETWRSKEEANWCEQLRQKEVSLRAKWREREAERAYSMASAAKDYKKLETWLRKSLHEVESRERSLKSLEESLKMEYARKVGELELLQNRLVDEYQHQLGLEKAKVKDLEHELIQEKNNVKTANMKIRCIEEEFDQYREVQRKSPEGTLKVDVLQLQAMKAGLEAEVERERSEKHKALLQREEFRAHIHKLGEALQRHQEKDAVAAKRELEQLRLDYLAREERFMLDGDREELQRIKHELDCLKSSSSPTSKHNTSTTSLDDGTTAAASVLPEIGSINDKLLQWRTELLKQGNSPEHRVIRDIDKQIGLQCQS